jgi:exosome complex RNA-binding protein Csl4
MQSAYPFATLLTNKRPPAPPTVGAIVTAKVLRTNLRTVNLDILPTPPLAESFSGLLRASDVRSSEIDAVELHRCFRPGDIVRARVLSLGDQRAYYLTTAEDDLGVVRCRSKQTGDVLVPLDAKTVICEETKETEERKAAVVTR